MYYINIHFLRFVLAIFVLFIEIPYYRPYLLGPNPERWGPIDLWCPSVLDSFKPQPQSWGPIELGCPSVCPSVCHSFLVRARTFERKVIETWL